MRRLENGGPKAIKKIIWVSIYQVAFLVTLGILHLAPMTAFGELGLVQQGIDLYNDHKLKDARDTLESAEVIYPNHISIPYYLGLIYLEQGHRNEAITQWKKYVAMAPHNKNTAKIRKNITILLRKAAKAYAREAAANEASLQNTPIDNNTVAVSPFANLGSKDLGPLGKGMAAMIIVDLSQFKDLKVVEREKLQALLDEIKLGSSGLVDQKNAPRIGKLLRAQYVTSGSLTDFEIEDLQISSILLDADTDKTLGNQETKGKKDKFYDLEKKIACRIVTDLGRDCSQAPKAFGKIHTKSLPAMEAYSKGLDYTDQEKYDKARTSFKKAVDEDPEFDLAKTALVATPFAALLLMSESQMASSTAASAPPSTATASATSNAITASTTGAGGSAGTGASVAASTAAAGGGVGIGTTAAIAGGVALAGGAAAVVANADPGDGGGDNSQNPIAGQWRGTWHDQDNNSGTLLLNLTEDNSSLTGDVTVNNSTCIDGGQASGSFVDGNRVQLDVSSSTASATLDATLNVEANTMEGTLQITGGSCEGTTYDISTSRTGSANVEW